MEPDISKIRIVLMEPEGAFNIGSVARVMKNMGLSELALVNPVAFRNDDGYRGAVGARDILDKALLFPSLKEAIKDTNLVVGTTRRAGRLRRIFCSLEELPERIFPILNHGKVSIVFGREKSGLTTGETDLCNLLVNIPADKKFPSLNLSHAAAVVCYKLFTNAVVSEVPYITDPAQNEEVEGLLDYIQSVFADIGFFAKGTPDYVINLFRKIFGRALLDNEEIKNLTHIFHRLYGLARANKGQ
ncbi:MAG: RNA methyltransferase [Spirochaetota bacterium]|nr:MAG: RNA methyltransferase [Spirochaetota bacterium]